jgi:AraC-like DNA-binding protein
LVATTIHFSLDLFDRETLGALLETPGFRSLFVDRSVQVIRNKEGRNARWLHVGPDVLNSISFDLDEIMREVYSYGPLRKVSVRALMLRHLVRLSRLYETYCTANVLKTNIRSLNETSVAAAVCFIDENFASNLRVNEIAKMVYLSPDHFTEVFSAVMGRTPSDYIRHIRVEHAKAKLQKSDLPITQVALECGLGDHSNLCRIFRISTGLTPTQYRTKDH